MARLINRRFGKKADSSGGNKCHIALEAVGDGQVQGGKFGQKLASGAGDHFTGFGPHMEIFIGESIILDQGGKNHLAAL